MKSKARRCSALVLLPAALLLVTGCGQRQDSTLPASASAASPDWRAEVAQFANTFEPLVSPVTLPSRNSEAQALRLEGQSALTFATPGEPLVTICGGNVVRCRAALGTSLEVRRGSAEGVRYVVALGRPEDPVKQARLSRQLATFWSDVQLTTKKPPWLSTRS